MNLMMSRLAYSRLVQKVPGPNQSILINRNKIAVNTETWCPTLWESLTPQKMDALRSKVNIMNYWCHRPEKEVYVLNKDRPTWCHCFIISLFTAQHVSNVIHPSSGACDLLWIYFMCCIALVRCVLVLRCGLAVWCGILMQAEALLQSA